MEYVIFILIGAIVLLGSAIGSIAGNMIASELYDRAPSLAAWLIELAVHRLPEHERGRYREEWVAHLNEYPGKLGKVWHSLGCFFGANAVACAAVTKRSTSFTTDSQHQIYQEKRIQERSPRSLSGPVHRILEVNLGKVHVVYGLSEKAMNVLSLASENMTRDADLVDQVKDLITKRYVRPDDTNDD